jgi:hypothetical protein
MIREIKVLAPVPANAGARLDVSSNAEYKRMDRAGSD